MVKSCSVTEQLMMESDSSCDACRAKMRTPSSVTWRARDIDSDLERAIATGLINRASWATDINQIFALPELSAADGDGPDALVGDLVGKGL
jgi:hypothetical protein